LWKVTDEIDEVLKRIELSEKQQQPLPNSITAHELLQMCYRGQVKLTPQQIRSATECLPFESPKLSAAAVSHMNEKSFAAALERAIERSKKPLPLPAKTIEHDPAELKGPMSRLVRRF
jgi:hypothetical protein